ncbi:hypothetical protein DAQ1742_00925 [Dickeya aquatica]|uniref:Uncharacterized protein n=1 Tax=Dickeya aquatica TaxID=1401087 RepID=A0A375A7M8_9GAMM|nr:hypothetical protein DAQ1742_00925 [Dickeya aquatica]
MAEGQNSGGLPDGQHHPRRIKRYLPIPRHHRQVASVFYQRDLFYQ